MSNFKSWTRDKLREKFGLKREYDHPVLRSWLNAKAEINDFERTNLLHWHKKMLRYVDYWNEEEVKLKFIGHIISLTDYDTDSLSSFADRYIAGTVNGIEMSGNPDFMVARGKQEVKSPFFFLHEYKKELNNDTQDPAGQLLASMLLAYEMNLETPELKEKPVYGAYVIGRQWFFVVLQDRLYSISDSYAATHEDELMDIYRIMKSNRAMIREIWGE